MYGKIFEQIYDSSVCQDWKALVVFQQMIILSDRDGVIDKTPESISRRTNIPLEIIKYGINILEQPDSESRCPDEGGRRIIRLDDHRTWGWKIVNKEYYRDLASENDKREKSRIRQKRFRILNKQQVTPCNATVTPCNANNDIQIQDTDTLKDLRKKNCAFDRFWSEYPKKKSKGNADKMWNALKATDELVEKIMAGLRRANKSFEWQKDNGQFVPYPAKWLKERGWEDEYSKTIVTERGIMVLNPALREHEQKLDSHVILNNEDAASLPIEQERIEAMKAREQLRKKLGLNLIDGGQHA